jgi:hypothetical protein
MYSDTPGSPRKGENFITETLYPAVADALSKAGDVGLIRINAECGVEYPPASLPGMPPHKRTGNLLASTSYSINLDSNSQVGLVFYATEPYAKYLRDGTSKMASRKFFTPEMGADLFVKAIEIVIDEIQRRFK